ncbi:hypothetical protein ACFPGO_03160 [Arcanobacterium canis]|uniref:Uncharacterized protein n=1 Tax=Arcanobacterium canis TaxID=999183 RepID=A0ABY8FX22_9ACTO|nr:hypothetical protein [Arcanobacterium canis]WFM83043.1 hypothetical protein P7079_06495 [Arcanobacterium canis]
MDKATVGAGQAKQPHTAASFERDLLLAHLALSVLMGILGASVCIFVSPDAGAQLVLAGAFFALAEFASRGVWALVGSASAVAAVGAYGVRILALFGVWMSTSWGVLGVASFGGMVVVCLVIDVVILTSRPIPFVESGVKIR